MKRFSPSFQRGQALVETLVVGALLVTFVLLLIFMGKLSDIRWHSTTAARGIAFDCAANNIDCKDLNANSMVVEQARRRQFLDTKRGIFSNDASADDAASGDVRPFWNDRLGKALIEKVSHVTAKVTQQNYDAWEGSINRINKADGKNLGSYVDSLMQAGPDRFGLKLNEGFLRSQVQTEIAKGGPTDFSKQLNRLALKIGAQAAVLSDDWAASGPGDNPAFKSIAETSVATRVNKAKDIPLISQAVDLGFLPLMELMKVMDVLKLEANGREFKYHYVDMDLVPADRLGP